MKTFIYSVIAATLAAFGLLLLVMGVDCALYTWELAPSTSGAGLLVALLFIAGAAGFFVFGLAFFRYTMESHALAQEERSHEVPAIPDRRRARDFDYFYRG